MLKIILAFKSLKNDEVGATAIEYGLIVALIVLAALSSMTQMSDTVVQLLNDTMGTVSSTVN